MKKSSPQLKQNKEEEVVETFRYEGDTLFCEGVSVLEIVEKIGTPCFIYSVRELRTNAKKYLNALSELKGLACYAVKANSNIAILKLLFKEGMGADVVSIGELFKVLKADGEPEKTVFAGVGKTREEIEFALKAGILMFNVESEEELLNINEIAISMNKKAPIAIRVNPDVDPKTHPYISTGLKTSKFGIDIEEAYNLYLKAKEMKGVEIKGIHFHIGSQITVKEPFIEASQKVLDLVKTLKQKGINIMYFDMGGGIGIKYKDEKTFDPWEIIEPIKDNLLKYELIPVMEPGRSIVGNAGILVTKILYKKHKNTKLFYIVDSAMNDLARPSLYNAYHEIISLNKKDNDKEVLADVVGPICESGDFLAKDRQLPLMKSGEYLVIKSAGAYGMSMSSNYNMRRRAAEVLVDGDKWYLIRERETLDDLLRHEIIP